jgi:hypothetical protein|tara:strand:- start:3680 stop:4009 length:330 start_codon:yes stop_codon:yes gene_type:complete
MKKEKDLNKIAKIEKAIEDRWGDAAIQNPASYWDEEKEKEYLKQLKEQIKNEEPSSTTKEHDGILITSKLFNKRRIDKCPKCDGFKLSNRDKVLVKKLGHCQTCEWKKN